MRILLWCAGRPGPAAGSLARGVAVAEAAVARGHQAVLSASVDEGWTQEIVAGAGVELVRPAATGAELRELADEQGAQLVHLDGGPIEGAEALSGNGFRLSQLDEQAVGDGLADLVVRPAVDAAVPADPDGVLTGPAYAPVRSAVRAARERRLDRAGGMGDRLRVLVRLGGRGSAERMLPVVEALTQSDLTVDVLALAPDQTLGMAAEALSNRRVRVLATVRRADLPRLVADHDLVITRPGQIVWELCCIGAPVALVTRSEAEASVAERWVAAGVAVGLGPVPADTSLAGPLRALLRDGLRRADLGNTGMRLVDGQGADRVAGLMERLVG